MCTPCTCGHCTPTDKQIEQIHNNNGNKIKKAGKEESKSKNSE